MSFRAYMLHCADRTFYVGHTDDLEDRIAAHASGTVPGYTSTRLPITLVWSQEFPSRIEALEMERRLKGWSRAKKLALIRGDWEQISTLAKGTRRASTSSARTDLGT
jgi:predicted GIY-YIG superfamily endonuclease